MKLKDLIKRFKDPNFRIKLDSLYGLGNFERLFNSNWYNPIATLWLNFRSFPLKQAWKLPFSVYGLPRLYSLSGRMIIKGKVKTGMIKFNITKPGAPGNSSTNSELNNHGLITFKGSCEIGTGNKITVLSKLTIGRGVEIMDHICITSHSNIHIDDYASITYRCNVMDTNFHFLGDLENEIIMKYYNPIYIGKYCWICNSSNIMGGGYLPDYTIVTSMSLVNKDYSYIPNYSMIGGVPAKFIKSGVARVRSKEFEKKIWQEFVKINSDYILLSNFKDSEIYKLFKDDSDILN